MRKKTIRKLWDETCFGKFDDSSDYCRYQCVDKEKCLGNPYPNIYPDMDALPVPKDEKTGDKGVNCNRLTSKDHLCKGSECPHWNHEIDNCPIRNWGCISKSGIVIYCHECKRVHRDSCYTWTRKNNRVKFLEIAGIKYEDMPGYGETIQVLA